MTTIESQAIGWLLSTLVGSGVAWWALRGRLTMLFQTRAEAEERKIAHHRDVERVEAKIEGVRTATDRSASRLEVLTAQVQGERDRIREVQAQVRSVEGKVDGIAETQAAVGESLKALARSLDHLRADLARRP